MTVENEADNILKIEKKTTAAYDVSHAWDYDGWEFAWNIEKSKLSPDISTKLENYVYRLHGTIIDQYNWLMFQIQLSARTRCATVRNREPTRIDVSLSPK